LALGTCKFLCAQLLLLLPAEKVKNVLPTAMSTLPLLILAATVASFLPSPSAPQVVVHSLYLRRAHKGFIQRL